MSDSANPASQPATTALLPSSLFSEFACVLGDTPHTAIDLQQVLLGRCRVYRAGDLADFAAAVVQIDDNPAEVNGYGSDPAALDRLLAQVPG